MDAYLLHVLTLAAIGAIAAMAFNLSAGYAGLLNLGHIALAGAGGYASAVLAKTYGWSFPLAVLAAIALPMALGFLLSLPARKVRGDYFALVTLGFAFVALAAFLNWDSVTRGALGIPGIPRPDHFSDPRGFFVLCALLALVAFLFLDRLLRSPYGRMLEAVRDDEEVAASLGKNPWRAKAVALAISGALAGLSGSLIAHFTRVITPTDFWLDYLVWTLAAIMVGGIASVRGSVLGVVILVTVEEILRQGLDLPSHLVGPVRLMVFMVAVILVVLYRPKGLIGRASVE